MEWENICFEFISSEILQAHTESEVKTIYRAITPGFHRENTTSKSPKQAWYFLMLLARRNGELPMGELFYFFQKKSAAVRQQKLTLSKTLKNIFKTDEDPIIFLRKEGVYKCLFRFKKNNVFDVDSEINKIMKFIDRDCNYKPIDPKSFFC